MKKNYPKIGITGPDRGGSAAWIFTAISVLLAGGRPIRIKPNSPVDVQRLDGLILGGGADIDPDTYQDRALLDTYLNHTLKRKDVSIFKRLALFIYEFIYPLIYFIRKLLSAKALGYDKDRDRLEVHMLSEAFNRGLPILGICRGAQLMNIFFDGTLYEDIQSYYHEKPNPSSIFPVKKVFIEKTSKLAEILGTTELYVNALHHQAVDIVGQNLNAVAKESNRVIQGIEHTQSHYTIGVQWHPELLLHKSIHRQLFTSLVRQSALVKDHSKDHVA